MTQSLLDSVADIVAGTVCEPQLRFIADQGRWIVCVNGRQCGKDWTSARIMLMTALERPHAEIIYTGQTRDEARRIMWADETDGLPAVARQLGIPVTLNESRLELRLANGSKVTITGLDRGGWEKVRGSRLDLLVVTEMQKADDEGLRNALRNIIPAALASKKGRFIGVGTPEEFCVSVLWEICKTDLWPQFSLHHWDASENDRRPDIWEDLLKWKSDSKMEDDDPTWMREGLGEWVRADDKFILPLLESAIWNGDLSALVPSSDGSTMVPRQHPTVHYAGLDFGGTDPSALVIGAQTRDDGGLRETLSWKSDPAKPLDNEELYSLITPMLDRFGVRTVYCDNARPETILRYQRLYSRTSGGSGHQRFVSCDKTTSATESKELFIKEMRAAMRLGRLQVLRESVLHDELKRLKPDPKAWAKKKITSVAGSDDHCYDAFRYLFRGVWNNRISAPDAPKTEEQVHREQAIEHRRRALSPQDPRKAGNPYRDLRKRR